MDAYSGEVSIRRTRFVSDATGWAVVEAAADDGMPLVLVGPLNHLERGDRAHVIGTWVDDKRFGPQIKVSEARPLAPAGTGAVAEYLVRVKHLGPKRAERLIERYGASRLLEEIDEDPGRALRAAGLRGKALREATASWDRLRVTRRLHMLLAPHGLAYLAKRIHAHYGDGAHRVVAESPYELTSVFGVGFQLADRIARGAGVSPQSPQRARAGMLHLLAEAERGGSTCQSIGVLLASLAQLLGTEQRLSRSLVDELVSEGDLEVEGEWVYRAQTARLEAELAERVSALLAVEPRAVDEEIDAATMPEATDEQRTAVRNAFTHRLSLITGGPGTGKTVSIRAIGALAARRRAKVMLVAPTGRAAVRMTEATGLRAQTVHSALGWVPGEGPTHDEDDPLRCDLLIVDESSMANLELLVTLFRAVSSATNVVLVGDADQLAPVGAGKPFAELVTSGLVPTARLTHIFRQAAGSMIVQGAHAIRRGAVPQLRPREGMRRDMFLVERADPAAAREEIVSLVSRRLPEHYDVDPVRDIQVFAPVYRGELGIDRLNDALRDALNPNGPAVAGGRLRVGDKVMLTGRNLHELGLMNGSLLRLLDEIEGEEDRGSLLLSSDDGVVRLGAEDSERLKLAYACSVHRGQGIELPVAVLVAHPAAGAFFLRREMLYTAVTRAKLATVIVGSQEVVARAAATADTGRRHSRLVERLA